MGARTSQLRTRRQVRDSSDPTDNVSPSGNAIANGISDIDDYHGNSNNNNLGCLEDDVARYKGALHSIENGSDQQQLKSDGLPPSQAIKSKVSTLQRQASHIQSLAQRIRRSSSLRTTKLRGLIPSIVGGKRKASADIGVAVPADQQTEQQVIPETVAQLPKVDEQPAVSPEQGQEVKQEPTPPQEQQEQAAPEANLVETVTPPKTDEVAKESVNEVAPAPEAAPPVETQPEPEKVVQEKSAEEAPSQSEPNVIPENKEEAPKEPEKPAVEQASEPTQPPVPSVEETPAPASVDSQAPAAEEEPKKTEEPSQSAEPVSQPEAAAEEQPMVDGEQAIPETVTELPKVDEQPAVSSEQAQEVKQDEPATEAKPVETVAQPATEPVADATPIEVPEGESSVAAPASEEVPAVESQPETEKAIEEVAPQDALSQSEPSSTPEKQEEASKVTEKQEEASQEPEKQVVEQASEPTQQSAQSVEEIPVATEEPKKIEEQCATVEVASQPEVATENQLKAADEQSSS